MNGIVEVQASKDEVPEADPPAVETKEEGTLFSSLWRHF